MNKSTFSLNALKKKFKTLGPGVIAGGADNDPAGIITYTIIGATTGFSQLWLMVLSTPMMIAVQSMASRISIVTGKSLPEVMTLRFSKKITVLLIAFFVIMNIITMGADLDGLATIMGILTGLNPLDFLIIITAIIAYLVMFNTYRVVKTILMVLTLFLFVYVISAILIHPDVKAVISGTFIPGISLAPDSIFAALGLLGTTLSPYMLFWQAATEREEHRTVVQAREADLDTIIGMFYSNFIAYFIIVASAAMFYENHININTLQDAALAIKPLGGDFAFILFSIGVIISGFLSIPVLAGSTAYAIADTFGWREGMDYAVSDAKGFYMVFLGSLLVGDLINLLSISPVDALFYSQVLDGVLLPVLIIILLLIGNSKNLMGSHTNSRFNMVFGVLTIIVSIFLTCMMFYRLAR